MRSKTSLKPAHFLLPSLLIAGVFIGCESENRALPTALDLGLGKVIMHTSLEDVLHEKSIQELKLKGSVQGLKFKQPGSSYVCYFEYNASTNDILTMLAHSPFSMYAAKSDTTAQLVHFSQLDLVRKRVAIDELENASAFWTATAEDFDAYVCDKAPLHHIVLVHRKTQKVLHRIAFNG